MRVTAGTARGINLTVPRETRRDRSRTASRRRCSASSGIAFPMRACSTSTPGAGDRDRGAVAGASSADFVERDRSALAALRGNLERTRLETDATVHATDVERFPSTAAGPWDIAVLDPPYEERDIVAPLRALVPLLAPGASVVVKHFWRTEVPEVDGLTAVRQRRFGETMLTFLEARDA